jgi:hypothetical protein
VTDGFADFSRTLHMSEDTNYERTDPKDPWFPGFWYIASYLPEAWRPKYKYNSYENQSKMRLLSFYDHLQLSILTNAVFKAFKLDR